MLQKDFEKSEEINHFSQESKDLISEMGNTEISEFNETSSERQSQVAPQKGKLNTAHAEMHAACGKESTIQQRQI